MKIGVQVYFGGPSSTPEVITAIAHAAESSGLNSLWIGEHAVLFKDYVANYPYAKNGRYPLDINFVPVEPFVALTYVAAVTKTLRVGTSVLLLPQRNPVYTAKSAADLDVVSGGRFDFGIGVGWCREEFEALDVPWDHRGPRADEYIQVMKALWADGEANFSGRFYKLEKAVQNPKPVQRPHPPILVGGENEAALRRIARNDGWIAFDRPVDELKVLLGRIDGYLAEQGRKRSDLHIVMCPFSQPCDLDMLKRYRDLGVDEVILFAFTLDPATAAAEVRKIGDQFAAAAADL